MIDEKIDELYQRPLSEFTAARNALAKSLGGDEGRRVRQLTKPTLVPWTVNQLYWTARPTYERLMTSGATLRLAQVAALEGRNADVRKAADAHRAALAESVQKGTQIAAASGARPGADVLARMLEALSLAAQPPEHPGRFADLVQPGGFDALTGVTPVGSRAPSDHASTQAARSAGTEPRQPTKARAAAEEAATGQSGTLAHSGAAAPWAQRRAEEAAQRQERARAREQAERERRAAVAIQAAERALERAKTEETRARRDYERAKVAVRDAEQSLAVVRTRVQLRG